VKYGIISVAWSSRRAEQAITRPPIGVDDLLDTCAQPTGGQEQLQREQECGGRTVGSRT
jgi:hypothetical protein